MSKEIAILGGIIVLVIIIAVVGTSFYRNSNSPAPVATNTVSDNQTGTNPAPAPVANPETLVREDSPTLGPADAKVTIVEFMDPECESCALFHPVIKKVLKDNEGKVRYIVRYMPLHPNSFSAAAFLETAGEQGKYWQALDYLFEKQPEWGTRHGHGAGTAQPDVNVLFKKYAEDLGLDIEKMNAALAANRSVKKVERDEKDGESLGVRQTPTIFVNGRKLPTLEDMTLRAMIVDELKK